MKKKVKRVMIVAATVMTVFALSFVSSAEEEMPRCLPDLLGLRGAVSVTYETGGVLPELNYFSHIVCGAIEYEWTTSSGYTTTTTSNILTTDASIFNCGSAWISVRAKLGSGYSSTATLNVTVTCLP